MASRCLLLDATNETNPTWPHGRCIERVHRRKPATHSRLDVWPKNDAPSARGLQHRGGERLVQVAGQGMVELPGDGHWAFADVTAIPSGSEKPEGTVVSAQTSEQEDAATVSLVVAIAQSGRAIRSSD